MQDLFWTMLVVFKCKEQCAKLHVWEVNAVSEQDALDTYEEALQNAGIDPERVVSVHMIPPLEPVCAQFRAMAESGYVPPLPRMGVA